MVRVLMNALANFTPHGNYLAGVLAGAPFSGDFQDKKQELRRGRKMGKKGPS